LRFSTHDFIQKGATFIAVFALVACSTYPDVNKDPAKNNRQTFERDAVECARAYPDAGSGVHVRQRITCMNLKGWQ
jgi:hypothetical protein